VTGVPDLHVQVGAANMLHANSPAHAHAFAHTPPPAA
jgi:hypothetical protein